MHRYCNTVRTVYEVEDTVKKVFETYVAPVLVALERDPHWKLGLTPSIEVRSLSGKELVRRVTEC